MENHNLDRIDSIKLFILTQLYQVDGKSGTGGISPVAAAFADHIWFARGSASVGRAYKGGKTFLAGLIKQEYAFVVQDRSQKSWHQTGHS